MNRMGLGLAVGAGYLLGRTKKLKMAVAVGGLVAGKKLNLSPRMVAELLQQQLRNNPQFKEIGDQLREDLRGVGKAASGAMVERQLDALSDRLHGRTAQMRDQLTGAVPGGREDDEADDEYEDEEPEDEEPRDDESEDSGPQQDEEEEPEAKKAPAKRPSAKKTAKKAAKKAPAKKAAAKKAPAKKTAAKKTTAAKKATSRSRGGSARSRLPKGGGEG
ncbi:DNA primase [Streptomyces sp. NPDC101110]|uniref:DNA primase n=1 Tax=unclassified Streptomyces TaxID=2593676 RepID=UPI00380DE75C